MKLREHFMSKVAAGAIALSLVAGGAAMAQDADTFPENDATIVTNDSFTDRLNPANYELNPYSLYSDQADPYIIGGAAALFGLLCLAGIARRRYPAASGLVLLSGAAVTMGLLNPEFVSKEEERRPTEVAVVIDESISQNLETRAEDTQAVTENIMAQLKALGIDESHIHVVRTDGTKERVENGGTNIFTTLPDSLSAVTPHQYGATIMVTDGQIHDIPHELSGILAQAPFYGVISGDEDERDRYIDLDTLPLYGLVNEGQEIKFRIVDQGVPEAELDAVDVTVRIDGQVYQRLTVMPNVENTLTFNLSHAGENVVEIEADGLENELTLRNNKTAFSVEGVRDAMRVLMAVGNPYTGSVSWRMALKSDPNIDLVHFNILRTMSDGSSWIPTNEMSLIAFPTRELFEERIDEFDLIIMDSFGASLYLQSNYINNVRDYVNDGGALLVVNDKEFSDYFSVANTSLREVLPADRSDIGQVVEQPFRPAISDYGDRHPVTRDLAEAQNPEEWGRWFRMIETGDITGDVLMEGADGRPLLIMDRAGEGRVAMLMSNQQWLWQRGVEGGGPYIELLRNIAHWSMAEPALEEEALRLNHDNGAIIVERQTMANVDALPAATVTDPDGEEHLIELAEVKPGLWQGKMAVDDTGLYEVTHQDYRNATSVGLLDPLEYRNMLSTTDLLKPAAEQTQGQVMRFNRNAVGGGVSAPKIVGLNGDDAVAGEGEIGVRMNQETILRGSERESLPPWLYAIIALGAYMGGCFLEGRRGGNEKNNKAENNGPKPSAP